MGWFFWSLTPATNPGDSRRILSQQGCLGSLVLESSPKMTYYSGWCDTFVRSSNLKITCWRCEFVSWSILALLSLNEEMGRVGSFHVPEAHVVLSLTLKVRMYLMESEGKELVVN